MPENIDLRAYLNRIHFDAPGGKPGLALLAAIQRQHTEHIPFENLNPLLGEEVRLAPADLEAKLIHGGRGGYCYEHNLLLLNVLIQLGFQARGLAARVFWNHPDEASPPRTHMLLLVCLDGAEYLVDAGFGGTTPTGPLRLDREGAQSTPHEDYRIRREGPLRVLQVRLASHWRTVYKFDLQEQWLADYEVASWYLSHHPASMFVTNLVAALPAPGCRHSLFNDRYTLYHTDGHREERRLTDAGEVLAILETVFGLDLPERTALQARVGALLTVAGG